jgi:hypothetical protein
MSAAVAFYRCLTRTIRRVVLVASFLALGFCLLPVASNAQGQFDEPFVLTQVPRRAKTPPAVRTPRDLVRCDWFEGARVVLVGAGGQVRILSEGFSSACDPNVSFDGQHILFAGRKGHDAGWRIWEIGADGQGLRAITPEQMDARSAIYATTLFTLDSPESWFTAVFVGRESFVNEAGRVGVSSLYNIKLDGTELRRLTFNPNHNFDPFQTWDGRVLYSAERYRNQPGEKGGRVGLYAIHVEGADMELYGGELGQRVQQMPCVTPGGLVVFVESNQGTWDGAGQLACLGERRPHVTYRQLTKDSSQLYLYPSPLRDNVILVSRRSIKRQGTCGVYRFDVDSSSCELVFDSPDYHDLQAMALLPRRSPDGHSTAVDTKVDTGIFYGLNCYDADQSMAPYLTTGMVKRVRFLEGVPQSPAARSNGPVPPGGFVPRRLVGEAPVEEDGSFNVELPADIPLLLQTLDADGMALATCGWIWVKPKEKRGCIGCHEDPERTPENEFVLALRRPSNRLVVPAGERRSISFAEDIAPILQKHCANSECHGGNGTPLRLPLAADKPSSRDLELAYAALLRPLRGKAKAAEPPPRTGKYVDAGRSRTSWLVWQLTGTNTSRVWDKPTPSARNIRLMPPQGKGTPLLEEERRTILQWIDLGAPCTSLNSLKAGIQPVSTR